MSATLITGATGGLGRAFVFLCAERGDDLFLTGRSEAKLSSLREEVLSRYPALSVKTKACLLSDESDRQKLFEALSSETISTLINVAGADIQKAFTEYTQEKLLFQLRVNLEAALSLTRFVLDHRTQHVDILTISSVSGIYPMPYFAVYSATKGALTSFFSALHVELKGIANVTTVLPGAMPTREDVRENIRTQGLWGKIAALPPETVALRSLKALQKNRRVYIPGFWNNVMNVGTKLLPLSLKMKFIASRWSKTTKDAF